MKHGTGDVSPTVIAECEVGLDFRYARAAGLLFGKGAYNAEDAAYTDKGYAYKKDPLGFQMFLVVVAAGKVYEAEKQDLTIVMPPAGFDSIRGTVAANHKAVMVYDLNQASVSVAIQEGVLGRTLLLGLREERSFFNHSSISSFI